jgi:two-component system chemotaxis response regulator CheY
MTEDLAASDADRQLGGVLIKILIVDDSETVRCHVRTVLEQAGFAILEAPDGIEGLRVLQENPEIAAIVVDVNMPRMNGMEMLERMRTLKLSRPALVLTSEADLSLISRAKAAGAKGWLVKPAKSVALTSAVKKILG